MNIIIIADKFQKRMKSKGCVGLIKDKKNKFLFQKQYESLKKIFPESNIVYVYGFDGKRMDSYVNKYEKNFLDTTFIHNEHYNNYNTAYSVYLCKEFLNNDCCILFGDNPVHKTTFKKFDPTIGSQIFLSNNAQSSLGSIIKDNTIQNIAYDLDNKLSEIYFLQKDQALSLYNCIETKQFHQYFLFELINKLIDNKHKLYSYKHK